MAKRPTTFRFHERTIRKLIRLAEANRKTKTAIVESLIWKAPVTTNGNEKRTTAKLATARTSN